ncbi:MAG: PAS domain S-box protein [Planctomycetota bacterium]|nr:MAG: PAS domain S-box protein [Planctomycetota bacterium]
MPNNTSSEDSESQHIAKLQADIAALRKTNQALIQRVENSLDRSDNTYALFERTVVLENHVRERTQVLEDTHRHLQELLADKTISEMALAQEKANFQTLFEESPVSQMVFRMEDLAIIQANSSAIASHGCTDLAQLQAIDIWAQPPFNKEHALTIVGTAQREGPQNLEWLGKRHDGSTFWQQVTVSIVTLHGQQCVLSSSMDISQRKDDEERLRLLTRAVEQSSAGVVITDTHCRIQFANQALLTITGYRLEELIGATPQIFKSGHTTDEEYHELWQTITQGGVWQGEFYNLRKDGTPYWEAATIAPVRDGGGEITHFVAIKEDISERKAIQQQVQQERLRAESASKAKSNFLANMSHEIRTPMNGVMGMAELLLGSSLNPQQRQWAETIIASAEQQLTVVNDVLEFSRLESGKMPIERKRYDLHALLRHIIQPYLLRLNGGDVRLLLQQDPQLPQWHYGDAGRIRQIIGNLLNNAVKFTESGHILVKAQIDHQNLVIEIQDTGIGIPRKRQTALFQPFEQVDSSAARRYGGSGLGLAICKRLAQAMGGDIELRSEEGRGSCFRVQLPLHLDSEQELLPSKPLSLAKQTFVLLSDYGPSGHILQQRIRSQSGNIIASYAENDAAMAKPDDPEWPEQAILIVDGGQFWAAQHIQRLRALGARQICCWISPCDAPENQALALDMGCRACLPLPHADQALIPLLQQMTTADSSHLLSQESLQSEAPASVEQSSLSNLLRESDILIAEDNMVNQLVLKSLLQALGCTQPRLAENGNQVLEAFIAKQPDVILMDVQMPDRDGLEATAAIRSWEREHNRNRTPIIAVTATAMHGDRERCLEAGMDEYLSKPIRKEALTTVLHKYLST